MKTKTQSVCEQLKQILKVSLCLTTLGLAAPSHASTHSLLFAVDGLRGDGFENAHTP